MSENIINREEYEMELFTIHTYKDLECQVICIFKDIYIKKG